jgi:hypothetical protein
MCDLRLPILLFIEKGKKGEQNIIVVGNNGHGGGGGHGGGWGGKRCISVFWRRVRL